MLSRQAVTLNAAAAFAAPPASWISGAAPGARWISTSVKAGVKEFDRLRDRVELLLDADTGAVTPSSMTAARPPSSTSSSSGRLLRFRRSKARVIGDQPSTAA